MKDFLLLFRGGLDFETASPEQLQQAMTKWKIWMDTLTQQGKHPGGKRLLQNGAVLKGAKQITDGPYAESKEIVGGYLGIKASDLNEAIEIAKGCRSLITAEALKCVRFSAKIYLCLTMKI